MIDDTIVGVAPRRWPAILAVAATSYYAFSALTLPWANRFWLGELSPLALIQLPKSVLKSIVHDVLMGAFRAFGFSHGSFSPDFIATHGWAMAIMAVMPAALVVTLLMFARPVKNRRRLIAMVLIAASIDGLVTFWFDSVSQLKLFNASFF